MYRHIHIEREGDWDVGKAIFCEANGRQVMRKGDRCRHRSSENAGRLARDLGKAE